MVDVKLTEAQTLAVLERVQGQMSMLKNCIARAVESGNYTYGSTELSGFEYAQQNLLPKLREEESLFRTINGAYLHATKVLW
jgi:hypothetical protein